MVANDTIVALATAPGESAIAVTRLSGPDALALASKQFHGRLSPADSASHRILFGSFLGVDRAPPDPVLLSVFRSPHSYTGEDVVEMRSHCGAALPPAVVDGLGLGGGQPGPAGEVPEAPV